QKAADLMTWCPGANGLTGKGECRFRRIGPRDCKDEFLRVECGPEHHGDMLYGRCGSSLRNNANRRVCGRWPRGQTANIETVRGDKGIVRKQSLEDFELRYLY